ncbi:MAG: tRNA-intron endonuclease [Candidatus Woesearchaeota archaeon]|jgi:tRNA-intron endonuclease
MKRKVTNAIFSKGEVFAQDDVARDLLNTSCFGSKETKGTVKFSLVECLYLVSQERMIVVDGRKKELSYSDLLTKFSKKDKNISIRSVVFASLRERGYVVKTALKFGGDFRVYPRGKKPGDAHAPWVVVCVKEDTNLDWKDFSGKNRVAHSTRKKLLMAVVDDENDVTYFECGWIKP